MKKNYKLFTHLLYNEKVNRKINNMCNDNNDERGNRAREKK